MNFLRGTIRANGAASFDGPNGLRLPLHAAPAGSDGRPVVYGIRPEHFVIADDGAEASVQVIEPTGSETQVVATLGGARHHRRVSRAPSTSSRATRSGSSPTRGLPIFSMKPRDSD